MFVCCECRNVFSDPISWMEDRGECFGFPSYEQLSGSPCCKETYVEAYQCNECGEWIITDNYIKIGHDRYCEDCYAIYELGEEN